MLDSIFARQLELQVESFGVDPRSLVGTERYIYLLNNFEAIADELAEMRAEVHWKMWASVTHGDFVDRDAFVKEGVDLLHFLVNLFLLAGASADEVLERYFKKAAVNAQRQADGYDAQTTKCPGCGRGLDEPE